MVAIDLVAPVRGDDQEVRPNEPVKHLGGAGPLENGIANVAGQPVQDRSLDQEVQRVLVEPGKELVPHVVGDEPVVAVKVGDGGFHPVLPGQREARQIEPDGPALGALD